MIRDAGRSGATEIVAPDLRERPSERAPGEGRVAGPHTTWRRLPPSLAGLGALGAVVMVAVVDPNQPGHYPVCPSLLFFGVYCPGCGSMRAVHDLAHLDVAAAWGMNPLVFAVIPYVAWEWARWLIASSGRPVTRRLAPAWAIWLVFGAIVAFGVARNVPALAPWLAP